MSGMDDLVAFLGARYDEVQAQQENPFASWHSRDCEAIPDVWGREPGNCTCGTPARVLAEVDAKRRMVDAYLPPGADPHPGQECVNHEGQDPAEHTRDKACSRHLAASERLLHSDYVLRLLALPYADHPDYRDDWRP